MRHPADSRFFATAPSSIGRVQTRRARSRRLDSLRFLQRVVHRSARSAHDLAVLESSGVFAGIDMSGGVLSPDNDANTDVYGANVDPKEIVFGSVQPPHEAGSPLKELRRQTVATTGVK